MFTALKAKLYPNKAQEKLLTEFLDQSRYVYNKALEQRRDLWKNENKSISLYGQQKWLTGFRRNDQRLSNVLVRYLMDGLERVDNGFKNFFRRVKAGQKPGYPRFKSRDRWNSVSHNVPGKLFVDESRLKIPGILTPIRCRGLQRIDLKPKKITLVYRGGSWFIRIRVDDGLPVIQKQPIIAPVGIDLGLEFFLTTSGGEQVENPRFLKRELKRLRGRSRALSRSKKNSNRRRACKARLQRIHARVVDLRDDFTHQVSRKLVNQFDFIAVEKLKVERLVKTKRFSRSIYDASWSQFVNRLTYKAERAGRQLVLVDPRNTSQECSSCGLIIKKELSDREHRCNNCGLVVHRDINAARNILQRALKAQSPGNGDLMHAEGYKTLEAESSSVEACRVETNPLPAISVLIPLAINHAKDTRYDEKGY